MKQNTTTTKGVKHMTTTERQKKAKKAATQYLLDRASRKRGR